MCASLDAQIVDKRAPNMTTCPDHGEPNLLDVASGQEAELLGLVVDLMQNSDIHRNWTVADINRLIIPPILLGQCFTFVDGRFVCGWFSWALLTAEAEEGYLRRTRLLQPADWNAGDGSRVWIIDALAPRGGVLGMARRIKRDMRFIANQRGWVAKEARWARSLGTRLVRHIGRVRG